MVITGVIRPPPEIRAVADRTALFVAKNGRAFETRILSSEKGKTPKFAFLHSNSPFHAYYEDRIRFYEEGGQEENDEEAAQGGKEAKEKEKVQRQQEEERKKQEEQQIKKEKAQKASALDPVARALLNERTKIIEARAAAEEAATTDETAAKVIGVVPPPKLSFVGVAAPANVSPVQLETIKLVAQFTALNGKGGPFLQQLAIREWNNPLFAFMQPRHGHFSYFSALTDGYRVLLSRANKGTAHDDTVLPMAECAGNVSKCLSVAAYRAEFDRDAAERRREEMGDGLSGAAIIDWHDFVVVETIEFPVDEIVSMLPPPPPQQQQPAAAAETTEEKMEESDEEDGETIRVVPDYTPKIVSAQSLAQDASRTHVIDPITGKSIPIADMPEHMRIQLLDPKWAEEKKKFMEKQKESNLVRGDVIASNISRFAQARGDLFGTSKEELLNNEADSKKRLEEANRIIREQAQNPQPRPISTAAPPNAAAEPPSLRTGSIPVPPPPVVPAVPLAAPLQSHPSPDASAPPAKRSKLAHPTESLPPSVSDEAQPLATTTASAAPLPPASFPAPPDLAPVPAPELPETVEILPEAEFAASLADPMVTLSIQIPNDPSNAAWNFNGQLVSISVDVMSKARVIKAELKSHLGGMPMNKMQLKSPSAGFLKDTQTLAKLNIGPTAALEMVPKTRGGRK